MFNPLNYPVIFLDTDYVAPSAWRQHTPFARLLIAFTEPSLLVELGTHYGVSYFAFCQAVKSLALHTRCYAVDTWQGDEQAGFYGEEVFEQVRRHNDQAYGDFSQLLRMTFDEALERFAEGEIDLLHIDGCHTYDAVRHDYESWLPKMSARGVMVFHDINVRTDNFGVWQLWHELRDVFPYFEFLHEHGLGVLAVGAEAAALLSPILSLSQDKHATIGQLFSQLGQRATLQAALQNAQVESRQARARARRLKHKFERLLRDVHESYAQEIERARTHIQHLEHQLAAISQERETERAAHAQEIENARGYIYRIEQELAMHAQQLETERAAHAQEIESMASRIEQLGAQLTAYQTHIASLENARAAVQTDLSASEEKCAQLEARLAETQAVIDRLQRKLDAYRAMD